MKYLNEYKKNSIKKLILMVVLLGILFACLILSLSMGSSDMSFSQIMKAFFHKDKSTNSLIIYNLRLPRIITAIVVGAGLSIAGCVMQSVLKNQLASASTLGVSQGASFGAGLSIVIAELTSSSATAGVLTSGNIYITTICAFLGAMCSSVLILLFTRFKKLNPPSMILVGVSLSSLFSGGLALIQYFASDTALSSIVFWTLGNLGRTTWDEIAIIGIVVIVSLVIFMINSWKFNAMDAGIETAKSLGINVDFVMVGALLIASIVSGTSVAFVGLINFIGLVAPHIARKIIGNNYIYLIPTSSIIGAIILVLADLAGRMIIAPVILPIGAITSFLGAPLFLYLIFREKNI